MKHLFVARLLALALFTIAFPVFAQTLKLTNVLEASKKENSDIKVLEAKLSELEAKSGASTNISAPMIGISYMGTDGPFKSSGMKEKPSYELSQTIPFPTKIFASMSAANSEVRAGRASKEYEQKLIEASVKAAFWNYYQAYNEKKSKVEQLEVLKDHLRRVNRSFVSDTLTNSHILSIQNEVSLMESEIDDAELSVLKARNVLFVYTGLPKEELNQTPEELPLSQIAASNLSESTLMKKAKAEVQQYKSQLSLAKNSYLPDLTIKYKWNSEFASIPRNQEVMLGIDLPFVFFWQPRAEIKQARARLIESQAMETKARRETEASLANFSEELAVKKRKLERLESTIIPRSEKRLKLAHSISFSDMQSLDEHRMVLEDSLKLKLERLRLRADFEKQISELEVLRGSL